MCLDRKVEKLSDLLEIFRAEMAVISSRLFGEISYITCAEFSPKVTQPLGKIFEISYTFRHFPIKAHYRG